MTIDCDLNSPTASRKVDSEGTEAVSMRDLMAIFFATPGPHLRSGYALTAMRAGCRISDWKRGIDKWGADGTDTDQYNRYWRGIPPNSKGDYAFTTHMIETAKRKSGRVAVIVPHSVLFRGGAEGKIGQQLIEENLLDSVVGLPANLFTTTSIPAAILIFDRSREEGGANADRKDVLFIDASKDFTPSKAQSVMEEGTQIKRVLDTYGTRVEVEKYSHLASTDEIAMNGYNLDIPRYVDTFEPEEEIDVAALQADIVRIETELGAVRFKMAGYLKYLGIDV